MKFLNFLNDYLKNYNPKEKGVFKVTFLPNEKEIIVEEPSNKINFQIDNCGLLNYYMKNGKDISALVELVKDAKNSFGKPIKKENFFTISVINGYWDDEIKIELETDKTKRQLKNEL